MPIPDPLRERRYASGALIQQCGACHWAQRGQQAEFTDCPRCGAGLTLPLAIVFGGTGIVAGPKTFYVYNTHGAMVALHRADIAEIVQFLCRHAEDRRTGQTFRDAGPVQSLEWTEHIEDHFWGRPPLVMPGYSR